MNGLCECGCGGRTSLAVQTSTRFGHVKGQPVRYLRGHAGGRWSKTSPRDRLWASVDVREAADECWPWIGARDSAGYGRLYVGRRVAAHRLAYELTNGPIPDGQIVRHACDNPPCCNPAHLLLGTQLDNMRDAKERLRHRFGSRMHNAKLDEAKVREIRALCSRGVSRAELALRYGVHRSTINHAVNGHSWRHVGSDAS